MSRGKHWTPMMDDILRRYFADEESKELARQFGYGLRTIERHAKELGLSKSPELLRAAARKGSDAAARKRRLLKEKGEKIRLSRPGGKPFQKGHRWDQETEARRVEGIRLSTGKKNLEKNMDMSNFAPQELKKMPMADLKALLQVEMDKVLRIRKEIDRRTGGGLESEMARGINFEERVTD